MNLEDAIRKYYTQACAEQHSIKKDDRMKLIMQGKDIFDFQYVKNWMEDYGLFQGISDPDRSEIVATVSNCLGKIRLPGITVTDRKSVIAAKFSMLFAELYNTRKRSWLSATSKLLWCSFPDDIVIYDSYVERFIIVMQWLEDELIDLPRLGNVPKLSSPADIPQITDYYMRYQDMVYTLFQRYLGVIKQLRTLNQEKYPHDIRIFDKILWIMSKPSSIAFPE